MNDKNNLRVSENSAYHHNDYHNDDNNDTKKALIKWKWWLYASEHDNTD